MNFPSNLKYSKDHEWVSIDGDGKTGVVGITDFAQHELGDIVYVDINTVGDTVAKNVVFGTVEAVKTVSDLYMPVGGKVLEVNKGLETAPEAVNKDPYGDGWIIKIEITDLADMDDLMDSEEYKAHVGV